MKEFRSPQEHDDVDRYLKVCLDRLLSLGVTSMPTLSDIDSLSTWSDQVAIMEFLQTENFIKTHKLEGKGTEKENFYATREVVELPHQEKRRMIHMKSNVFTFKRELPFS